MAAIHALTAYGGDSDSEENESLEEETITPDHIAHLNTEVSISQLQSNIQLKSAPEVTAKEDIGVIRQVDPSAKEVNYNPRYEEMFTPQVGPSNPFKTRQQTAPKNTLAGYVEPAHVSDFTFETQRRTFTSYGYALDPSATGGAGTSGDRYVGDVTKAEEKKGVTIFEVAAARVGDKRKREKPGDPGDIEGYKGPWATFVDESKVAKPSEEQAAKLEEFEMTKQKRSKKEEKSVEEKTTLHVQDSVDYQGRSYLHIPHDIDTKLDTDEPPERCFLPKKHIHTWTGHTKGVSCIRFFPRSAHLLLSCSMDCKIKLWEVYGKRRCLRTFMGHSKAVRDISFNNPGTQFLSAAYDRYVKLWDTETGECIGRFTNRKIPYCVKFNPDEDKQHLFVCGTSDKKILTWDTRANEIVQEYDRHLGAVNTITFVDQNRRFVTTSDDKSIRVWEWDIPVDFKYIAEPSMHSMPAVALHPNDKWMACQSMDNQIMIFGVLNRFRQNRKKTFKGHMVAGYACQLSFSPDGSYLISGDADGKLCIWDWKSTKLYSKFKAHDAVCISCLWHPHETSKVVTCGWDGLIKYWD
ncbi:pre-mRNA-processing factor 17-like [Montipora capricornis]|uniref:pre-mRNA-processing factor 17-like n=1 Tax=Montipora foliosa TaxID=591990 RepID=UPI0035F123D7